MILENIELYATHLIYSEQMSFVLFKNCYLQTILL